MRWTGKVVVAAVVLATTLGAAATAGAVAYDRSNPVSTGCSKSGYVNETRTARTYGPWSVRIVRSTGCRTAWGLVNRTDGKACRPPTNCTRIKIVRQAINGTKAISSRKQVNGTGSQISLQYGALAGARWTATVYTYGGTRLGDSAVLVSNADGSWSLG